MKKTLLATLCFASVFAFAATAESDSERRKRIAKTLYGRIEIVDIGEDYRVKVVDLGADLRVKIVDIGADDVGRWKLVDLGEDIRVKFVDIGEGVAD